MDISRIYNYNDFSEEIYEFLLIESNNPKIKPKDPRIDIVDNFTDCVGYPGQGTHNSRDWASRNAWDLKAPAGSKVYALFDGKLERFNKSKPGVTRFGVKRIFGDQVNVKTTDSNLPDVFYTHIDSIFTNKDIGREVKKGQVIGTLCNMIPPHLHIGLRFGNLLDYVGKKNKPKIDWYKWQPKSGVLWIPTVGKGNPSKESKDSWFGRGKENYPWRGLPEDLPRDKQDIQSLVLLPSDRMSFEDLVDFVEEGNLDFVRPHTIIILPWSRDYNLEAINDDISNVKKMLGYRKIVNPLNDKEKYSVDSLFKNL